MVGAKIYELRTNYVIDFFIMGFWGFGVLGFWWWLKVVCRDWWWGQFPTQWSAVCLQHPSKQRALRLNNSPLDSAEGTNQQFA